MAKFTKFNPMEHIKGLAKAAQQLQREYQEQEAKNFEECMDYFRDKAEQFPLNTDTGSQKIQ